MRRISYSAFLLFYIASTDAISQERVFITWAELQRSLPPGDRTRLDAGNRLPQGFPKLREAKPKGGLCLSFGCTKPIYLSNLNQRRVQPQARSLIEEAR